MQERGLSQIGMLVTLACIAVLLAIMLPTMRKSVTGDGQATPGSAWGYQDQIQIQTIVKAMTIDAMSGRESFLVPSEMTGSDDVSENTSTSFWSAMIMQRLVNPEQLIAPGDQGWVEQMEGYDYSAYDPRNRVYWDDAFSTDLNELSNVSYAHMPIWGARQDRWWRPGAGGAFPIVGSRGPVDGDETAASFTVDQDGVWRGWVCFADGSIKWIEGAMMPSQWRRRDGVRDDNLFLIEDERSGDDAILGVTKTMDDFGPILQWD